MKLIVKNKPIPIHYRLKKMESLGEDYSALKNNVSKSDYIKDEVLIALLTEQNYLCAYCMKKVSLYNATIEHIIGQNYKEGHDEIGKRNQLKYDNFLAVCDGRSCYSSLHCDKSRANYQKNRPLFADPLENRIVQNIKFSERGYIYYKDSSTKEDIEKMRNHTESGEDSNIKYDLQFVLNLNCTSLKEKRKLIISALKKYTRDWSNKERIKKEYDKYTQNPSHEFSQVAIYHLSKKLT